MCVCVCLFGVSEQKLVQDLCVSSVWPVMEKHDTVLHWGKAHSWLTQLRTLHTDGTNLLRSLSASFSRQIFVLIYFQVLQDGPKTEPNRYKWPFKSMETSLVFFHPKELWNLFHPIRKWLVGLCWFVPKTVAFFSSATQCRRPARWAPKNTTRVA